eukprot:COSAG05_NODE_42_length_26187_cov_393.972286_24_plen_65_part_00
MSIAGVAYWPWSTSRRAVLVNSKHNHNHNNRCKGKCIKNKRNRRLGRRGYMGVPCPTCEGWASR